LLNQSNMRYILLSYKKKTIVLSNEKLQLLFLKNLENLIYISQINKNGNTLNQKIKYAKR